MVGQLLFKTRIGAPLILAGTMLWHQSVASLVRDDVMSGHAKLEDDPLWLIVDQNELVSSLAMGTVPTMRLREAFLTSGMSQVSFVSMAGCNGTVASTMGGTRQDAGDVFGKVLVRALGGVKHDAMIGLADWLPETGGNARRLPSHNDCDVLLHQLSLAAAGSTTPGGSINGSRAVDCAERAAKEAASAISSLHRLRNCASRQSGAVGCETWVEAHARMLQASRQGLLLAGAIASSAARLAWAVAFRAPTAIDRAGVATAAVSAVSAWAEAAASVGRLRAACSAGRQALLLAGLVQLSDAGPVSRVWVRAAMRSHSLCAAARHSQAPLGLSPAPLGLLPGPLGLPRVLPGLDPPSRAAPLSAPMDPQGAESGGGELRSGPGPALRPNPNPNAWAGLCRRVRSGKAASAAAQWHAAARSMLVDRAAAELGRRESAGAGGALWARRGHRIRIVTLCAYPSATTRLASLSLADKVAFCRRFGYHCRLETQLPPWSGPSDAAHRFWATGGRWRAGEGESESLEARLQRRGWGGVGGGESEQRQPPPAWLKVQLVREETEAMRAAGESGWVMWMDCDSFVTDPGRPVEAVLARAGVLGPPSDGAVNEWRPPGDSARLIVSEDPMLWNTGIFFLAVDGGGASTPGSALWLLDAVAAAAGSWQPPTPGRVLAEGPATRHSWWENAAIVALLTGGDAASERLRGATVALAQNVANAYPQRLCDALENGAPASLCAAWQPESWIMSFAGCKAAGGQAACNEMFQDGFERAQAAQRRLQIEIDRQALLS